MVGNFSGEMIPAGRIGGSAASVAGLRRLQCGCCTMANTWWMDCGIAYGARHAGCFYPLMSGNADILRFAYACGLLACRCAHLRDIVQCRALPI